MSLKSIARKNVKRGIAKKAQSNYQAEGVIILNSKGELMAPWPKTGRGFTRPLMFVW